MKPDLPTPTQILEELADRVVAQIERSAPVAFASALREMTRYHRFLLSVNATRTPDGAPFSYAQVPGDAWQPAHRSWIKQYGRLFEIAANRIPDDDSFIERLAHVAMSLVPDREDPEQPPEVLDAIVGLGPILVHRLEAWRNRRLVVETVRGGSATERLALAGSDARAFSNAMMHVVGAWESLLTLTTPVLRWRDTARAPADVRWSVFSRSWPFVWSHLQDTAYNLVVAVWNEDEDGTVLWREALMRWGVTLDPLDNHGRLLRRDLVYPDIFAQRWEEALARVAPLVDDYVDAPTPDQLFGAIVRAAHRDVVILTASLLTFWTLNSKQSSDIGARTANVLLHREFPEVDDAPRHSDRPLTLSSLLMDLLRLRMAGDRWNDDSYGAQLDKFVATLDNMTERRVVPGRVYTPSTLHDRDGLAGAHVSLLTTASAQEDAGAAECIAALAEDEALLPAGDASLRQVLGEIELYERMMGASTGGRATPLASLSEVAAFARDQVSRTLARARELIVAKREARLRARQIDPVRLERLRGAIEKELLEPSAPVFYFQDVIVEIDPRDGQSPLLQFKRPGLSKAQFTEPPMENLVSNLTEHLVTGARDFADRDVLNTFRQQPWDTIEIDAPVDQAAFWSRLEALRQQVGPHPVLLVSRMGEGRVLQRLVHRRAPVPAHLIIRNEKRALDPGGYIGTFNDVEVYATDLSQGAAWLFSAHALESISYGSVDAAGHQVLAAFEPVESLVGEFTASFRQSLRWRASPAYILQIAPHPPVDS